MDRLAPALRRVAAELDLPRGPRAAVLAELAADLEAVYEHHRRQGADEETAARASEERVLGSPDVVRRLSEIHGASWRGWSAAVGSSLGGGLDLVLLLAGVLPVVAMAAAMAVMTLARGAGPAAWALAALGVAMTVIIVAESVRLAGGAPVRSTGLSPLLGLSVLAPIAGLLVLVVEARRTALTLSAAVDAGSGAWVTAVEGLAVAGSTFLLGLLLGIAGSLSWFILLSRSSARVVREVEAMLAGAGGDGVVEPAPTLSLVPGGTQ